jgi:hypothetical protein
MSVRVTCISKAGGNHLDRHEGITDVCWVNESTNAKGCNDRQSMIDFIEKNGHGSAYVRDSKGDVAYVGVVTPSESWRKKYLRTYADGVWNDNLLALSEC